MRVQIVTQNYIELKSVQASLYTNTLCQHQVPTSPSLLARTWALYVIMLHYGICSWSQILVSAAQCWRHFFQWHPQHNIPCKKTQKSEYKSSLWHWLICETIQISSSQTVRKTSSSCIRRTTCNNWHLLIFVFFLLNCQQPKDEEFIYPLLTSFDIW